MTHSQVGISNTLKTTRFRLFYFHRTYTLRIIIIFFFNGHTFKPLVWLLYVYIMTLSQATALYRVQRTKMTIIKCYIMGLPRGSIKKHILCSRFNLIQNKLTLNTFFGLGVLYKIVKFLTNRFFFFLCVCETNVQLSYVLIAMCVCTYYYKIYIHNTID